MVNSGSQVPASRPWAQVVGYSRAVRQGRLIEVSGTVASTPEGEVVAPGDPYLQTQHALRTIGDALAELGASFANVIRTRLFLTDISDWEMVGKAHGEVFGEIRPASSFVQVAALLHPDLVVEIEATAIVDE